jgi:hypothetical protein
MKAAKIGLMAKERLQAYYVNCSISFSFELLLHNLSLGGVAVIGVIFNE